MGSGILSISKAINSIKPDILIVYADRFEGFAAVFGYSNEYTYSTEGGDITEGGALDDSIRHAMTKLAHIHITTNKNATNRIIAMGEEKWRVKTFGFPGIDLIKDKKFINAKVIEQKLSIEITKPIVLFTQHSVTTEFNNSIEQIKPSLEALRQLLLNDIQVIITYPNNDAGGKKIIKEIKTWERKNKYNKNLKLKIMTESLLWT